MPVRAAAPGDAAALASVWVRGWQAAYRGILTDAFLAALDPSTEAAQWRSYVEELPPGDRLWVAEADGRVAGLCRSGPARDADLPAETGEIYALYLDPGLTGRGVGSELLGHAVAALRAAGQERVAVWAFEENEPAIRFYGRFGFVRDGARRIWERSATGAPEVRLLLGPA